MYAGFSTFIRPSPLLTRFIAIVALGAATVGFFGWYPKYEVSGPELLADAAFAGGFTHWERSGLGDAEVTTEGDLVLRADQKERGPGVAVRQSLPEPKKHPLLRLSGELKADSIQPGGRFWQKGRLVLVSFDAKGRMMRTPHVVADLVGTTPWQTYAEVFRVPDAAQTVQVGVQLIGATGSLAVRKLSLHDVRERDCYSLYRDIGITAWVIVLAWVAIPFIKHLRLDLPHCLIVGAVLSIAVGALMPGELKTALEFTVSQAINQTLQLECKPGTVYCLWASKTPLNKLGHIVFFAWLSFTLSWAYPNKRLPLMLGVLALASVSEILQLFVDGRHAQVSDVLLDSVGLLLGLGIFTWLPGIWRAR